MDEFTLGKSGRQRGAENVASVIAYLDELDRAGERVPLNPDGSPNYSEIARLCGFGRQVFYTNEKARQLVEQRIPPIWMRVRRAHWQNRRFRKSIRRIARSAGWRKRSRRYPRNSSHSE